MNPIQLKKALDNRANQLNPNNETYWKCRGLPKPSPSTTERKKK